MLATRFESMLLRKFNVRLIIGPIIIFIFKLNVYESHTHLVSKIIKYICIFDRILTYHSLYIKYSCALIDVPFGSDGASWELIVKGSLKLLNVVLNVAVKCSGLHELGCINLAQPFYINWSSILINPVMSLRIVPQYLLFFFEVKILSQKYF